MGKTVEGRPLEIEKCVGDENAPYRVFLRRREPHAWEAGGNWIVQGLVDRLLADDAEAKNWLFALLCLYHADGKNKDAVARGRTRFNMRGKDLNREWDKPVDPVLAPENYALEQWLEAMIKRGSALSRALGVA